MATRQPIVTIVGHVDHGKTTLLDTIRQTTVAEREAGAITQAIGASIVPMKTLQRMCGKLLESLNLTLTLPGLLFIDTPGHAAFSNMRRRGGNLADIAILIVDINEGLMPQTIEAIEILKKYKTPFIIAANKVDQVSGWRKNESFLLESISKQSETTQQLLDTKVYEIVGKVAEFEFESDRFDRLSDYTKQIAIVPICARSGEGVPELLMVLTGLAQKFLEKALEFDTQGAAKGTILEVKEAVGLGTVLDTIIYDGTVNVGDTLVVGGLDAPLVSKVKSLVEPPPLTDMREKKAKFIAIKSATAATGVRICSPGMEDAIGGMPLKVATAGTLEAVKEEIQAEVEEVLIETDSDGIILKADTLGSLEALTTLLKEKDVKIRKASLGEISKKDLADAEANHDKDELTAIILGFNVGYCQGVEELVDSSKAHVFTNGVIYKLIEDYELWVEQEQKRLQAKGLENLIRPCKLELMHNRTFRQSGPAIIGVDVQVGSVKTNTVLMKDGKQLTTIKSMKSEKDNLNEVKQGEQVAMALDGVTVGRQIKEGDILYPFMPESNFRELKKFAKFLAKSEIECLKEIAEIMRKDNPVWGV